MPNVRIYTEPLEGESPAERLAAEADTLADYCLADSADGWVDLPTPAQIGDQARRVKAALYPLRVTRPPGRHTPALLNAMLIIGFAAGALGAALALREGAAAAARPIAIGMGIGLALGYALGRWYRRTA